MSSLARTELSPASSVTWWLSEPKAERRLRLRLSCVWRWRVETEEGIWWKGKEDSKVICDVSSLGWNIQEGKTS